MRIYGMKVIQSYHGRSHGRADVFFSEAWSKACREKSAEVKVPNYGLIWEGLNHAVR